MGNQLMFGLFLTSDTLRMAIIILSAFLLLAIIIASLNLCKKCGKPWWYVLLTLIVLSIFGVTCYFVFKSFGEMIGYIVTGSLLLLTLIFLIRVYVYFAKSFGKGVGFVIGMTFLPMIFIPLLSFSDYVGNGKNTVLEQPIYNPFNETNVKQVMPETPINLTNVTVDSSYNSLQEPMSNLDGSLNDANNNVSLINQENIAPEVEIPEVVQENVVPEVAIPEVVQENVANKVAENPTIQDIRDALNINKEPSDIAFNSINHIENNNDLENVKEEILDSKDDIELPEVAAKVCPACGVSLANDISFCISCGTKL